MLHGSRTSSAAGSGSGLASPRRWPPAELILADEPVSMLDVSVRIGLLNLMAKLRARGRLVLYITHDIASARYVADRLIVMYAGQIAESGPIEDVLASPSTPTPSCCSPPCPTRERRCPWRPNRPGRAAQGHRPEARLPVPPALPGGHRQVRAGHAASSPS